MTRQATSKVDLTPNSRRAPTRLSTAIIRAKALVLQASRGATNLASPIKKLRKGNAASFSRQIGLSRSPLWTETAVVEARFQFGKVQNLRRAIRELNSVLLHAGDTFSFWEQIGRPTRRRGFVAGRMLQEGCIVPAIGGGLCQLSNALYEAALQANCEILERHAHTRVVPGSAASHGRDATVAWNYVDLRFLSRHPLLIRSRLTHDELLVEFFTHEANTSASYREIKTQPNPITLNNNRAVEASLLRTCGTCDQTDCFRFEPERSGESVDGRTVYLLDENWPEFLDYVRAQRLSHNVIGVPLSSASWKWRRYNYETIGAAELYSAPVQAFGRALRTRVWGASAARRRMAELKSAGAIAGKLSSILAPDITTVCVAQSYIPFLWDRSHIGGRRLLIMMTRLPMAALQERLDAEYEKHPERQSLADFRAPSWMVEAERAAIEYADALITPHSEIAQMFEGKSQKLVWQTPKGLTLGATVPNRIAFPGPTIARKGCYELREAAQALGLEVSLTGESLEGPNFWSGVRTVTTSRNSGSSAWLQGVSAVVQPSLVEENPRRLLKALSCGVPVIAAAACGLDPRQGLHILPQVDTASLIQALQKVLRHNPTDGKDVPVTLAHA